MLSRVTSLSPPSAPEVWTERESVSVVGAVARPAEWDDAVGMCAATEPLRHEMSRVDRFSPADETR